METSDATEGTDFEMVGDVLDGFDLTYAERSRIENRTSELLVLEAWLDAAVVGAAVEEVRDDDGTLVGCWAENAEYPGASAYGATPDEARSKLRSVLVGWVELGSELHHQIPSIHEGSIATTA